MLNRLIQSDPQFKGNQFGDPVNKALGMAQNPAHVTHYRFRRHAAMGGDL